MKDNEFNSFVMYVDFHDVIDELNLEQKGMLFDSIFKYQLNKSYKTDDPVVDIVMKQLTKTFERDKKKWLEIKEKRREAINKRWNKQKQIEKPKQNLSKPKNNLKSIYEALDEEVKLMFEEYLEVRKSMKMKETERSITLLVNKLKVHNKEMQMKMIEQSIERNYKSVFEIKENQQNYKNNGLLFVEPECNEYNEENDVDLDKMLNQAYEKESK